MKAPTPAPEFVLLAALLVLAGVSPVHGQGARPASSEFEGPHSEERVSVRTGSRPVHERGRSVHESSVGRLSGASVHSPSPSTADLTLDAMIRQLEGPGLAESETFDEEPTSDDGEPVYYEVVADPVNELQGLVQTLREVTPVAIAEPTPTVADENGPEEGRSPGPPVVEGPPRAGSPSNQE